MPRKRRRSGRARAGGLLIAGVLLGLVAWAILPHAHERQARRPVAAVQTPQPSRAPTPSPAATPVLTPSRIAATPSPIATASARVAIIIDDCGQWRSIERGYLKLPIPLTLAVLPDVRYTAAIAREAAAAGKGVMLHLPMEPISHIYPGPGEITTGMSDAQIVAQTQADLAQVPLAAGINNHEGSAATADVRVMRDVLAVAKEHGLFFIDSRTTAKTVAAQQAQDAGVPSASRNVFLDDKPDLADTEVMLERTVAVAKRDGSAIAIGHPKPTTLQALREMYPKMQAQGVEFVLVASLVH